MTFIAGLRIDGMTAPYVIDGSMDGAAFLAYIEQVLAPTLGRGDIVFMDNLRTHKVDGVREVIAAAGATVRYLPAYSPDLNPPVRACAQKGLASWPSPSLRRPCAKVPRAPSGRFGSS